MSSKWVVGVLSTDYDLHEHRTAVIELLKNNGVIPSAFEEPNFPVSPAVHSHDTCLAALERVDAAILIIDKRAGGLYFRTKDSTITKKEFIDIAKSKKPYFVFVSKCAWNERHAYRTGQKKSKKTEAEFDAEYACSYVESVEVIHFIDQIQNAYNEYGTSNWIYQFEEIEDLKQAVAGKLAGLSQYYCYKIAERQAEIISNRKTSTNMMLSLGDVFSKGFYVEPDFKVESGSLSEGLTLDDRVVSAISKKQSTLIIGEAGYGKTTILAKSYLTHFDRTPTTAYDIPFYINLKSRGSHYHFDFIKYINDCLEEYLEKYPYPFMNLDSIKPYFYLDSFDELAEKIALQDLQKISHSSFFVRPFLLTCRNQFAIRYVRSSEFTGKISNIININKWSPDKANGYIKNFCSINAKPDLLANIEGLLTKNQELCSILDTPLLITMLLWVIEQNGLKVPSTIKNRVQLFSECISELAFREIERLGIVDISKETMFMIWSFAAWEVYYAKIQKNDLQYKILLPQLKDKFSINEINESWFEAVFMSNQSTIVGTFHEQFLEYLSACTILSACLNEIYPFPIFLGVVVRPEINRYFRQLWNEKNYADKTKILDNIKELYLNNLLSDDDLPLMQRIHAIYHLSRMKFDGNTEFINSVLKIEKNTSVKISLYFGAIKLGLLDKEEELYQLLLTNKEYSDSNCGYHLAYYGDIASLEKPPFKDNPNVPWTATLNAFLRHFQSTEEGHYFLWRIELLTMRQLIMARSASSLLNEDILLQIKDLISNPPNERYSQFQQDVKIEFEKLCDYLSS